MERIELGNGRAVLYCGDALAMLAGLPDNSVDLIATDPPYFRVIGSDIATWDRAWKSPAEFLAWMGTILDQFRRVLRPNGSLYLFASTAMAYGVETELRQRFVVLNRITWKKTDGTTDDNGNEGGTWRKACKAELRSYFPQTETVFFCEHQGADSMAKGEAGYERKCDELKGFVFEPIRAYFAGEKARAGLSAKQIREGMKELTGNYYMFERHTFSHSQWCMPVAEQYAAAQVLFNREGRRPAPPYEDYHQAPRSRFKRGADDGREYLRADYEELRADYEELRRPFFADVEHPYTDVWEYPTVGAYPGKHPCEKPLEMFRDIVRISSKPGAVVLDPFMGSGVCGQAATQLDREFWGNDADAHWVDVARVRIEGRAEFGQLPAVRPRRTKAAPMPLFEVPA